MWLISVSPETENILSVSDFFNPLARGGEEEMRLDTERLEYWLGQGAKMSDRVKSLAKGKKRKANGQKLSGGEAA